MLISNLGPSPRAFGLPMRRRTIPKPKPELPHFLKENQAIANKTMQPSHVPDKGPLQQAAVSRLAQLGADQMGSELGTERSGAQKLDQIPKGLNLMEPQGDNLTKPSDASKPSTQMLPPTTATNLPPAQATTVERPKVVGTWKAGDAWANPRKIEMPKPDSFYDIDFRSRPPNNVVITLAPTEVDKSGKQEVQKHPISAAKTEFSDLTKTVQSPYRKENNSPNKQASIKQAGQDVPPHKRMPVKQVEQPATVELSQQPVYISPHKRLPVKQDEQAQGSLLPHKPTEGKEAVAGFSSTAVIKHVNGQSNDVVNAPTSHYNNSVIADKNNSAAQLTSSKLTQDQLLAQEKPSAPQPKGILRYFRPVALDQKQQAVDSKPEVSLPTCVTVPSPTPKPTGVGLLTDGSAFVAQALSNMKQKASDKAKASTLAPKKPSANTAGAPVMDEVIANINAKAMAMASPQPAVPSISNQSVRGRADDELSTISASLNFDDTFKGRNASITSETSVIVYQGRQANNPYQTNEMLGLPKDYEVGQLRGWDGNWVPPPVEWDLRDMFDYRKPQHQQLIKNFVLDRYQAFKKGLCPALNINSEIFTSGASLAVGLTRFGKPIDPNDHHHIRATDPFTLHKLHQTAALATENFCRVNKDKLEKEQEKERLKKLTKEEKAKMREEYEAMLRNAPPNPWKPVANIYIRPARVKDLPQVRAIHNHYTRTSPVTQERVELGDREMRSRFDDCAAEKYPFIVAIYCHGRTTEKDELVVGFAYAEDYGGENTMWRHSCEVQFYVHSRYLRKGIGKNLLDTLLRGVTPYYHHRNGTHFRYTEEEYYRHDGGGLRIINKVIVPFPYMAEEKEQQKWVGEWLQREFEFEVQCDMEGIGHTGAADKS